MPLRSQFKFWADPFRKTKASPGLTGDDYADILKSKAFLKMDPLEQIKVQREIQEIEHLRGQETREAATHGLEETELREEQERIRKIQGILESRRTPAQKAFALNYLAGVPVEQAREMVWGKREPTVEEPTRRERKLKAMEAGTYETGRPPGALIGKPPTRPGGVQIRTIEGETIVEPAGKWGERTPEERTAAMRASEEHAEKVRAVVAGKVEARDEARITRRIQGYLEMGATGDWTKDDVIAAIMGERGMTAADATSLTAHLPSRRELEKERLDRIEAIDVRGEKMREEKKEEARAGRAEVREERQWWHKERREIEEKERETEKDKAQAREDRIRDIDQLGTDMADKKYNRKIEQIKYEDLRKDADRKFLLDKEKLGKKPALDLKGYTDEVLKEGYAWKDSLCGLGFESDFCDVAWDFWQILDFNEAKETTRATKYGVTLKDDAEREAATLTSFRSALPEIFKTLNMKVGKEGLTDGLEKQISFMALLQFALDTHTLGQPQAIAKQQQIAKGKEWWLVPDEIPLKNPKAMKAYKIAMENIVANAKADKNFWTVTNRFFSERFGKDLSLRLEELQRKGEAKMDIAPQLAADLNTLPEHTKNKALKALEAAYNAKTGKIYTPTQKESQELAAFLLGDPKKELAELNRGDLGVNLSGADYIEQTGREPFWSEGLRGLAIRMKYDSDIWTGVIEKALEKGVLGLEDLDIKGGGIGEALAKFGAAFMGVIPAIAIGKKARWSPFKKKGPELPGFKEKVILPQEEVTPGGYWWQKKKEIPAGVEIETPSYKQKAGEIAKDLKGREYSDEDIQAVLDSLADSYGEVSLNVEELLRQR